MDYRNKAARSNTGPGGLSCHCCTIGGRKHQKHLATRLLRRTARTEISEAVQDMETEGQVAFITSRKAEGDDR